MSNMIAFCGLDCLQCGAFVATQENDAEKRNEVAALWSKEYGVDLSPEDINCDGCMSEAGIHFSHCEVCEIRQCGTERAVENCAHCTDYACDKLEGFFAMVPEAKKLLDEIRAGT